MRYLRRRQRQSRRTAFTLFEMLLVLTIVGIIAGLSWPRLARYLQENDLRSNAEQARRIIDSARVKAIREGTIFQFRYEPYGQKYLLAPYELLQPTGQEQTTPDYSGQKKTVGFIYQLTETCAFHPPEQTPGSQMPIERLSVELLSQIANGLLYQDVSWSPPILFYPDGSATNHSFSVQDAKGRRVPISVRGLTGTVYVRKLEYLPEGYRGR